MFKDDTVSIILIIPIVESAVIKGNQCLICVVSINSIKIKLHNKIIIFLSVKITFLKLISYIFLYIVVLDLRIYLYIITIINPKFLKKVKNWTCLLVHIKIVQKYQVKLDRRIKTSTFIWQTVKIMNRRERVILRTKRERRVFKLNRI